MIALPIHTDGDYRAALAEVSPLFDREPEPGTPEGDRFEVLVTLIEAYERRHFHIAAPDPIDAIKFRMEQHGAPTAHATGYPGGKPDRRLKARPKRAVG